MNLQANTTGKEGTVIATEPPLDVTLSIVNTNNRELLRRCLETIRDTVREVSYEVIVVDNASTDGSYEMLRADYPHVRVIRNAWAQGYGKSHNRAIARANGAYVLVLNEDMEMLEGAIDRMVEIARGLPDLGVLGCRILNPDGSLQHSCFRTPTLGQELFEAVFPYALLFRNSPIRSKMYAWPHDTQRDVDIVLGCCMLLPRAAIERVGTFDPSFFVYSEEHDLCTRMRSHGLRVVFTPEARMIHFGGQTSKRMSLKMAMVQLDSRIKYFEKHKGRAASVAFRAVLIVAAALRLCGWKLVRLRNGRDEGRVAAMVTEYRESIKFVSGWKRQHS